MKNRTKIIYLCITILLIVFGFASRLPFLSFFPFFVGDIIWAMMVYFIFAFIFPKRKYTQLLWYTIGFAFVIEFSQLLQWDWLVYARTTYLRYILGQGFLVSDLLCYTIGAFASFVLDKLLQKKIFSKF